MKLFFHFLFIKGAGKIKLFSLQQQRKKRKKKKKNPKQCDEQSIPERMRNNDECKIAVLWQSFLHKI